MIALVCSARDGLSTLAGRPVCSNTSVLAGRWVRLYWGVDFDCGEGYQRDVFPGIVKEQLCCSGSQQCNAPGAAPPSIKCFTAKISPAVGYCAGKASNVSVCASSQTRANEKAAKVAKVLMNTMLSFL